MITKILCLLASAKFNVKNIAFFLFHDFKGIEKNGGRKKLNARGSTRNLTSLIEKDLLSHVK